MLNITFYNKDQKNNAIAILINNKLDINDYIKDLDLKYHGLITKSISDHKVFKGNLGQSLLLNTIDDQNLIISIIILGIGDDEQLKSYQIEELGGRIYSHAKSAKAISVTSNINSKIDAFSTSEIASLLASGALLASYKFDKYFTKKTDEEQFVTQDFNIIVDNTAKATDLFNEKQSVALGVYLARDLVSEAPNILYPESYAKKIVDVLEPLDVEIDILDERQMHDLGMGAMLGVGQGSARESQLVVMRYHGATSLNQKPVCIVGKGVTFDTGGISLKPASNMGDMKYDMGGSASVVGLIHALALRKATVNVVGIVGLAENMPSGNAQRPGDIVTTMSGQTVEVLNTDAEGRLVLCDCLTYLQENFEPECIVDLATLTGAILVALANTYAGCFANNDQLANDLIDASMKSNEKLWRMPLHPEFDEMLKSPVADMANIGGERGMAGSSTAAHFLERFIKNDTKWAHLDIAGMAWDKSGKNPICPKGAVGFGVRLLNQFIQDNYEAK